MDLRVGLPASAQGRFRSPRIRNRLKRLLWCSLGMACAGFLLSQQRFVLVFPALIYKTGAGDAEQLVFAMDDSRLVVRCPYGLRVVSLEDGQTALLAALDGTQPGLAASPSLGAIGVGTSLLELASASRGEARLALRLPGIALDYSPDGQSIACLGTDGSPLLVSASDGRATRLPVDSSTRSSANWWWNPLGRFSRDGRRLAVRTTHGVHVWDVPTGELRLVLHDLEPVSALRLSPEGAVIGVVTRCRFARWSVADGGGLSSVDLKSVHPEVAKVIAPGRSAISPDLTAVAFSEQAGIVVLVRDGAFRRRIITGNYLNAIEFSEKGHLLAIGGQDTSEVRIWDVR